VCRHHDVTGKQCPWYYSDDDRWEELKEQILEGDMAISNEDLDRIAIRVWEYLYHKGQSDQDNILGKGMDSNRYNVLNAAYTEAKKANQRIDEIEKTISR